MVSSILAPVACSRYALSGSDSRSILSAAVVGIMLTRSVFGPPPPDPDFEHAGAAAETANARPRTRPTVTERQETAGVRTVGWEYHAPARPGNAGVPGSFACAGTRSAGRASGSRRSEERRVGKECRSRW